VAVDRTTPVLLVAAAVEAERTLPSILAVLARLDKVTMAELHQQPLPTLQVAEEVLVALARTALALLLVLEASASCPA